MSSEKLGICLIVCGFLFLMCSIKIGQMKTKHHSRCHKSPISFVEETTCAAEVDHSARVDKLASKATIEKNKEAMKKHVARKNSGR